MNEDNGKTRSLWNFFSDNYRLTYILLAAVVLFGSFSLSQLPRESAPEVDIPVVVVATPYPGASAGNVEELITRPLETELSGVSDLEELTSTSQEGSSSVIVEFRPGTNANEKIADVRARVDRARSGFPSEAGDTVIQQVSFSDVPIMSLALSGPFDPSGLRLYAEDLQERLESITNVSRVTVIGAPEREIQINLDRRKLDQFSLSAEEVIRALSEGNVDVPVGSIETSDQNFSVRVDSRFISVEDIASVPVSERNGALVRVSDVGSVTDGFSRIGTVSRFGTFGSDPRPTVSLELFKESGQGNILTIADTVEEEIAEVTSGLFPDGVGVEVIRNDADNIRSDLSTLITSGTFTVVIIQTILALFLGWREALLASVVVPVSFLMAFIIIDLFGLTINFLTLFSLILSLGILVDASIVVTESIFSRRSKGESGLVAARNTIEQFRYPLVAGTLTTVFVFAPMLLVSGVMGEFIKSIPITVSAVLLSALVAALGIVTMFAARFFKTGVSRSQKSFFYIGGYIDRLSITYKRILGALLQSKRASYGFLTFLLTLLVIVLAFPVFGIVQVNMFPSPDADFVYIDVESAPGTPLSRTGKIIEPIETYLSNDERVASFLTTLGQRTQAGSVDVARTSNSNQAGITVVLSDGQRPSSSQIVSEYEEMFSDIDAAEIQVSQPEEGPPAGGAIQVRIFGSDLDVMEGLAREYAEVLRAMDGTRNIDDGIENTAGELVIQVDRNTAAQYGVTDNDIASRVRTAVSGRTASDLWIDDENIDIVVLSGFSSDRPLSGLSTPLEVSELMALPVSTARGTVALDTFANVEIRPGRSSIRREDGERVLAVTADIEPDQTGAEVMSRFRDRIDEGAIPSGLDVQFGGEVDDVQESFTDLARSMLVGVLLICALRVWQLNSFKQPFFILVTIPLALIGVIGGLALVGQPLSFPGFIGVVALAGIVVNNAIILIDTINREFARKGGELFTAVINGSVSRMRPIVLTTITTVAGLVPLVFTGPTWAPVAYSILFGLLFSSILTLFVLPVLYYRFEK